MSEYWTIGKNKWNKAVFTEEQAVAASKTLTGCTDCNGCKGCTGCTGCTGCADCTGCTGCTGCADCTGCKGCTGCTGWKTQPVRFSTERIGSRKSVTHFYCGADRTEVICGCFRGALSEFTERVHAVYGCGAYRKQYDEAIAIMRLIESGRFLQTHNATAHRTPGAETTKEGKPS